MEFWSMLLICKGNATMSEQDCQQQRCCFREEWTDAHQADRTETGNLSIYWSPTSLLYNFFCHCFQNGTKSPKWTPCASKLWLHTLAHFPLQMFICLKNWVRWTFIYCKPNTLPSCRPSGFWTWNEKGMQATLRWRRSHKRCEMCYRAIRIRNGSDQGRLQRGSDMSWWVGIWPAEGVEYISGWERPMSRHKGNKMFGVGGAGMHDCQFSEGHSW